MAPLDINEEQEISGRNIPKPPLRVLIVEDEFHSRKLLQAILSRYGECDVAVNGVEAVEAFRSALDGGEPYDLILMDILMPIMDGRSALIKIRAIKKQRGIRGPEEVKVIMTSALGDPKTVVNTYYRGGATSPGHFT
jgi:two-component system, chemotaxis family, chemotaxis protein CheY